MGVDLAGRLGSDYDEKSSLCMCMRRTETILQKHPSSFCVEESAKPGALLPGRSLQGLEHFCLGGLFLVATVCPSLPSYALSVG